MPPRSASQTANARRREAAIRRTAEKRAQKKAVVFDYIMRTFDKGNSITDVSTLAVQWYCPQKVCTRLWV
jgi:hypothetical protein